MSKEAPEFPLELKARLREAGTFATVMGVLIGIVGLLSLITYNDDPGAAIIACVFYLALGGFYVFCGERIKRNLSGTKGLLITLGIITLPMAFGIIPILAVISFFRGVGGINRFNKVGAGAFITDEEYEARAQKNSAKNRRHRIIAYSLLGVLIALMLTLIAVAIYSSNNSPANGDNPSGLQTGTKPYISSEFGFTVAFPETPTINHDSLDVEGTAVPYVMYDSVVNNGNTDYAVQVFQYPTDTFGVVGQERGVLDGGINGMAGAEGYKLVSSSNNGTFQGFPSAEASFTYTSGTTYYDVFATLFIKGNDLYTIMTVGAPYGNHTNFVNSFAFNQ